MREKTLAGQLKGLRQTWVQRKEFSPQIWHFFCLLVYRLTDWQTCRHQVLGETASLMHLELFFYSRDKIARVPETHKCTHISKPLHTHQPSFHFQLSVFPLYELVSRYWHMEKIYLSSLPVVSSSSGYVIFIVHKVKSKNSGLERCWTKQKVQGDFKSGSNVISHELG